MVAGHHPRPRTPAETDADLRFALSRRKQGFESPMKSITLPLTSGSAGANRGSYTASGSM
jgi:hypothetical protein